MTNLIQSITGWVVSLGSTALILVLAYLSFKGSKAKSIVIGFFGGCVGLYLISDPSKMKIIGAAIVNSIMKG